MTWTAVEPWGPPCDADDLTRILDRLTSWTPLDVDAVLDDVADALDDVPPAGHDVPLLAQRLHAHFARLSDISLAAEADEQNETVALILARRSNLPAASGSGEPTTHQSHLRQLGWT
ncbi:hypothetical protein OHT17_51165 [Streptomyces sp. NBC_00371]|uniref:DUF6415 family natural product biosynthesis protein n=1 Tax=Streptomyces sp. NBC_00371 TaxID=2975729 RepID=UPI002E2600F4